MVSIRRLIFLSLCGVLVFLTGIDCRAETYPTRPIRLLVPYPAGGGADLMARLVSPLLSERLGQQVVVENHGGAGGTIGAGIGARAAPDARPAWPGSTR